LVSLNSRLESNKEEEEEEDDERRLQNPVRAGPLSSDFGTHEPVKARFCSWPEPLFWAKVSKLFQGVSSSLGSGTGTGLRVYAS